MKYFPKIAILLPLIIRCHTYADSKYSEYEDRWTAGRHCVDPDDAEHKDCQAPFGIIGGQINGSATAYFTLPKSEYSYQLLPNLSNFLSDVNSVSMNGEGISLAGGIVHGIRGGVYYIYPDGSLSPILLTATTSVINSVSLNNHGVGLAGGVDQSQAATAYLLYPNYSTSPLSLLQTTGSAILSVAINDQAQGLLGGYNSGGELAFTVSSGIANPIAIAQTGSGGEVDSVAINPSGNGIIGGVDANMNAFAYFVNPAGTLSSQLVPSPGGNTTPTPVAINASGNALIGVNSNGGSPSAYLIAPNGTPSDQLLPVSLTTLLAGSVESVALNDSQVGLIGGGGGAFNTDSPFLFYVYPDGSLSKQLLPAQIDTGVVNSVNINTFGTGLAVADYGLYSISYLVSPSGSVISMYPALAGTFDTSSMIYSLTQIITVCLGGNNLILAKYINKYAPEKAYYFLPSLVNGTLAQALASVAPTRNSASVFAIDNNLFMLNESLSRHLRDQRHVRRYNWGQEDSETAWESEHGLFAASEWPSGYVAADHDKKEQSGYARPLSLWSEVVTSFSYQKGEHQTPGFDPWTAGLILGFEGQLGYNSQIGLGTAYTYTYLLQHSKEGHSHINQEYLFAYGLFSARNVYADVSLWGGLFQIDQVRSIHLQGFHFKSHSSPHGYLAGPHFELGGDMYFFNWLTLEPFIMSDWANTWQDDYRERGKGPFNMGQRDHYSSLLRNEGGIRFYEEVPSKTWRLTFEQKASYVNKKPFGVGTVNAFLVGSPGSFTVETLSTTQNLGVVGLAFIFEPLDLKHPYGSISYQGEFGSAYQSHQLFFEACWSF